MASEPANSPDTPTSESVFVARLARRIEESMQLGDARRWNPTEQDRGDLPAGGPRDPHDAAAAAPIPYDPVGRQLLPTNTIVEEPRGRAMPDASDTSSNVPSPRLR